jgi:UDP-sulfoquinovose synthase
MDGYIGFPLAMNLSAKGNIVIGIDNFSKRKWVDNFSFHSAIPIKSIETRIKRFKEDFNKDILFEYGDLRNHRSVIKVLKEYTPDVIVHLGEQSSSPFSMIDAKHAVLTQTNNISGTINLLYGVKEIVPDCHLVKLGSIGEYGYPNIDIPEGFFEINYKGRRDILPFPKQAFNDWYHWSKVHDSGNIMLACNIWDLSSTDIMQGIVYGIITEEMIHDDLITRFDFDAVFGTCINRFMAQAIIGKDLTVYGKGGQKRPIISLPDCIRCLEIAIENPPKKGEYRVFNQFDEIYSIREIANKVIDAADLLGMDVSIKNLNNPRVEIEEEVYYNPIHEKLYNLGYSPNTNLEKGLVSSMEKLMNYKQRILEKKNCIIGNIKWK